MSASTSGGFPHRARTPCRTIWPIQVIGQCLWSSRAHRGRRLWDDMEDERVRGCIGWRPRRAPVLDGHPIEDQGVDDGPTPGSGPEPGNSGPTRDGRCPEKSWSGTVPGRSKAA